VIALVYPLPRASTVLSYGETVADTRLLIHDTTITGNNTTITSNKHRPGLQTRATAPRMSAREASIPARSWSLSDGGSQ